MPPRKPAAETDNSELSAGEWKASPTSEGEYSRKVVTDLFPPADNSEPVGEITATNWDGETINVSEVNIRGSIAARSQSAAIALERAVSALVLGDIITYSGGMVTWRPGHLEHIANLYAGDPQTTERNYADDLAVARAYSAETWEQLTNGK